MALPKPLAVVIFAAGQGTRMKSNVLKMLHKAAGKPLLGHMIDIARRLSPEKIIVVVGHQAVDLSLKWRRTLTPQTANLR